MKPQLIPVTYHFNGRSVRVVETPPGTFQWLLCDIVKILGFKSPHFTARLELTAEHGGTVVCYSGTRPKKFRTVSQDGLHLLLQNGDRGSPGGFNSGSK